MMTPLVVAIVSLAGTVLAGVGAYLAMARRLSGRIDTTEAADLWRAATEIREEMRSEIQECRQRIDELERLNNELRQRNEHLSRRLEEALQRLPLSERLPREPRPGPDA